MKKSREEIETFFILMFLKLDLDTNQAMNFFKLKNKCIEKNTFQNF